MKPALVFLQGGVPGVTPYASGPHIWGRTLQLFPLDRSVLVHELNGDTVDAMVGNLRRMLDQWDVQTCQLVGHDLGGLVALSYAAEAPQRVRSVTAVSSVAAAPTGDSVANLTFAHPPKPLFSRQSQRWALERISYSHHHIDKALLDACEKRHFEEALAPSEAFAPSLMAAKAKLYAVAREQGYPVPAQVIWGTHDPLGTFEQGLWLFRLLAAKQKATQFHAINRAGALPFREEPEAFHQIVAAFLESTC